MTTQIALPPRSLIQQANASHVPKPRFDVTAFGPRPSQRSKLTAEFEAPAHCWPLNRPSNETWTRTYNATELLQGLRAVLPAGESGTLVGPAADTGHTMSGPGVPQRL